MPSALYECLVDVAHNLTQPTPIAKAFLLATIRLYE